MVSNCWREKMGEEEQRRRAFFIVGASSKVWEERERREQREAPPREGLCVNNLRLSHPCFAVT
jgi:hypothetical protein